MVLQLLNRHTIPFSKQIVVLKVSVSTGLITSALVIFIHHVLELNVDTNMTGKVLHRLTLLPKLPQLLSAVST